MVWPWTLTFWPKNVIRSSVSQDAPVTKVWRKSIDRYWRYSGNMKIWDAFGHAVTLNFDLLTPKSNNLISSSLSWDAAVTKVWRKSVNRYWRYCGNTKLPRESRMHGRTHGQRYGRTTRKHIASAGAYRRRRLKKPSEPNHIHQQSQSHLDKLHQSVGRIHFYRAMQYAQLRIVRNCYSKLPVHLSVTLMYCGHTSWFSSKVTASLISLGSLLLGAPPTTI